jgi:hypothetical protein
MLENKRPIVTRAGHRQAWIVPPLASAATESHQPQAGCYLGLALVLNPAGAAFATLVKDSTQTNECLPLPLFIRHRDWHPAPLGPTRKLVTGIVTTAPYFGRPDTTTFRLFRGSELQERDFIRPPRTNPPCMAWRKSGAWKYSEQSAIRCGPSRPAPDALPSRRFPCHPYRRLQSTMASPRGPALPWHGNRSQSRVARRPTGVRPTLRFR